MAFVETTVDLRYWKHGEEKRGHYSYSPGSIIEWRPSTVECPYCHLEMAELKRAAVIELNRIISAAECPLPGGTHLPITGMPVPPTHILLSCGRCRSKFTAPVHGPRYDNGEAAQ